MKKKSLIIAAVAVVFGLQTAHAQYPQLTDEAADKIKDMKAQWAAHADSAWQAAFPIVVKEAI